MNIRSHTFIFIILLSLINPSFADNSWNGNGSIIGHSTGSRAGYGLTKDVSQVHPNSSRSPVVFFQWELNSNDGNKLKIDAENYNSATITYGFWDSSPSDKIAHANVSLPFVLDPSLDGLSNTDGNWYTIAVSFPSNPSSISQVTAVATNTSGTTHNGSSAQAIRLSNSNYWGGNGSLISKSSGNKTGFGITKDIAAVKSNLKSSVFFQWEVDSNDGKAVKISSRQGCFSRAKVTTGDWHTRSNDSARTVTLPHTIDTNRSDGDWVLIRVDLLTNSTCDDYVSAEITRGGGSTGGGSTSSHCTPIITNYDQIGAGTDKVFWTHCDNPSYFTVNLQCGNSPWGQVSRTYSGSTRSESFYTGIGAGKVQVCAVYSSSDYTCSAIGSIVCNRLASGL